MLDFLLGLYGMKIPQWPQLTAGVSRTAWEVTGYGFIYVAVVYIWDCWMANSPSSFQIFLPEAL